MSKNIKITERQYKMLQETDEDTFPYVTDGDFKPFDGYNNITANGKIDGETPGGVTTGDEIQQMRTMDGWNRYRTYGNISPTTLREGVNDADDIGETDAFDYIAKMKERIEIPRLVQERIKLLLASTQGLNVNQFAVILYDLINDFTSQSTNNQSRRVFDSLLREFQKRTGLSRTLEKELENAD